jgi:hypothetical protein
MGMGKVQVECGFFQVTVPEQELDGTQVGSPFQQLGRKTWRLAILSGRGENHLLVTAVRLQRRCGLGPLVPLLA